MYSGGDDVPCVADAHVVPARSEVAGRGDVIAEADPVQRTLADRASAVAHGQVDLVIGHATVLPSNQVTTLRDATSEARPRCEIVARVNAAWIWLAGVAGTLLGIAAKAGVDLLGERSKRSREDVVWRREHMRESAAEFLAAVDAVHTLARTVADIADQIPAARAVGPMPEHEVRERMTAEQVHMRGALERAAAALARLSILVEQETYLTANKPLTAAASTPREAQVTLIGTHLNNLLRAELRVPARVIAEGEAVTAQEFITRQNAGDLS